MTPSLGLRPAEILRMFWAEQLVIEETARFLEPVYFWEVSSELERINHE